MELKEAISRRRSIRSYKSKPLERSTIIQLLESANQAPSGANASPWLYVVVDDDATKQALRRSAQEADGRWNAAQSPEFQAWLASQGITQDKPFLEEAPVLIVAFADVREPYAIESIWLSLAFLILAITAAGLGTLTYTPGEPDFLGPLLGVPGHYRPQAILPVGYPREEADPADRSKPSVDRTARHNHYRIIYRP